MITTKNNEIDYLLILLDCTFKGTTPPPPENVDMQSLLKLSIAQQVYNTILPVLDSIDALDDEEKKKWNNYRLNELQKTIYLNNERNAIEDDLNAQGIKYMYLKGLIIREYYPQTSMRQMSDNDILYDGSKRDELYKIMKAHGFYNGAAAGISDDFYKDTCTIEFHRTLFNPQDDFCPQFNPFDRAVKDNEKPFRYIMSKEDNYIYALSHMYKHYHCIDGCGFRFICDLYLLTSAGDNLDWDYINATLERFGLLNFQSLALGVSDAVFGEGELTDDGKELINFMFEGSVYGVSHKNIADDIAKQGGRLAYLLRRIFPPKQVMYGNYINLDKRRYLLPFYYIFRLFQKSFRRNEALKRELNDIKNSK